MGESLNSIQKSMKMFQAIFFGVLAYGISTASSDVSKYFGIPISSVSITCMVFGILGAIITELVCRSAAKW